MNLDFQPLNLFRASELEPYLAMRKNRSCDSTLPDTYIWADYYDPNLTVIDGEALRTLTGEKYHKKLNLIHRFCHIYDGRWEYRTLDPSAGDMLAEFLDRWYGAREPEDTLEAERHGILYVLKHSELADFRIGGILIDGKLEALSIGSENKLEHMAIISVEKANPEIPGLYQLINQQFLLHAFPEAELVNREDDMWVWKGCAARRKAIIPLRLSGSITLSRSLESGICQ